MVEGFHIYLIISPEQGKKVGKWLVNLSYRAPSGRHPTCRTLFFFCIQVTTGKADKLTVTQTGACSFRTSDNRNKLRGEDYREQECFIC